MKNKPDDRFSRKNCPIHTLQACIITRRPCSNDFVKINQVWVENSSAFLCSIDNCQLKPCVAMHCEYTSTQCTWPTFQAVVIYLMQVGHKRHWSSRFRTWIYCLYSNLLYPRHLCRGEYSFRLSVGPFVCFHPFVEFASKFCVKVSQVVYISAILIRKHSYLDHSYLGGLAFTPCPWSPGSMPWGGARGQNLGHL